jgi:hypothetical protein
MIGLVKIGFTLGTVEGRAKELDATGTPEPFEIAYQVEVRGPDDLERRAHGKLVSKRVRNSREFFEVDVVEAILCVRSLANEPLGEECSPKYIELVDESAKRLALDREAKKNSQLRAVQEEKSRRFEIFIVEADEHRHKICQMQRELAELRIKLEAAPSLLVLSWIEKIEHIRLIVATVALGLLGTISLSTNSPNISILVAVLTSALLIALILIRSNAIKKQKHNIPIFRLHAEISNLTYDLDLMDHRQKKLPSDLSDFARSSPVKVDERGFEAAARKTGTFK